MMSQRELSYWHWKEVAANLPIFMFNEIVNEWHSKPGSNYETVVKKYLKSLSKLEQLIYTNEIQGE